MSYKSFMASKVVTISTSKIFCERYRLKMGRIYARAVAAKVIDVQSRLDRAVVILVGKAMRSVNHSVVVKLAVASDAIDMAQPFPATRWV
jgi:hypothetical protein